MPKVTILTSLYNCSQYLEGYFKCISGIENSSEIEILLLHNAPTKEETQIIQSYLQDYNFLHHHIIKERESLYATWNRGIALAQGEYIAIWNVDDLRFPKSIYQQAMVLDMNPKADISYGDFYYMYEYGILSKEVKYNIDFENNLNVFKRTHQIGCFPMWRKRIHDKIGFFDEQFRLVSDFDFQIRAAINNCIFVKCNNVLGAYLTLTPGKLSSNQSLQKKEQNALYLRYGIYDYLNWIYWIPSLKYKIVNIYNYNNYYPITLYFKDRYIYLAKRFPLFFLSIIRQPRNILSYIKHVVFKY